MAAFYIVLHHTLPHFYIVWGVNVANLNRLGQEAVILFFLISGFVIEQSFARKKDKRFSQYFQRRFYRIFIPLVIVFFIGYLSRSYTAGTWINPAFGQLLGNLLMLQDYYDVKPNVWVKTYMNNDPLWSLAYEWWFYMAFFPVMSCMNQRIYRDIFVFLSGVLAALVFCYLPVFPVRVVMYFSIWWAGVYLSEQYRLTGLTSFRDIAKPVVALLCISVILSINAWLKWQELGPVSPGFYPVLAVRHFVFAALAIVIGFIWKKFHWRYFNKLVMPFYFLAPISYTLYILHEYLFTTATYLDFIANEQIRWVSYFAILLLFSYIIELKIYPPLLKRFTQKNRQ